MITEPLAGDVVTARLAGLVTPSMSVSLASTSIVTGVFLPVVAKSSAATGGSLTGLTVMLTVATFEPADPSLAW